MRLLELTLVFATIGIFNVSSSIIDFRRGNLLGDCEQGKSFRVDCNVCFCKGAGSISLCTKKACRTLDYGINKRSVGFFPKNSWQQSDFGQYTDEFLQQQQQQERFQEAEEDSQIQIQLDFQQAMEDFKEELNSLPEDMDLQQDALDLQQAILDLEEEEQEQQVQQLEDYQIPKEVEVQQEQQVQQLEDYQIPKEVEVQQEQQEQQLQQQQQVEDYQFLVQKPFRYY